MGIQNIPWYVFNNHFADFILKNKIKNKTKMKNYIDQEEVVINVYQAIFQTIQKIKSEQNDK